jgi:hypothetical protein
VQRRQSRSPAAQRRFHPEARKPSRADPAILDSAELVEHILLGPIDDRRVLQDSPLLGDVWTAYALDPGSRSGSC